MTRRAWPPPQVVHYSPMTCRPVILPDYCELEFRIAADARSPALVSLDGKVFLELQIGDSGEAPLCCCGTTLGGCQGAAPYLGSSSNSCQPRNRERRRFSTANPAGPWTAGPTSSCSSCRSGLICLSMGGLAMEDLPLPIFWAGRDGWSFSGSLAYAHLVGAQLLACGGRYCMITKCCAMNEWAALSADQVWSHRGTVRHHVGGVRNLKFEMCIHNTPKTLTLWPPCLPTAAQSMCA